MKSAQDINNRKGFTLIELLVVIGILAVLLAIVLIAINPARQFRQARDTQRASDVTQILNAVHQYMADPDRDGTPPAGIPTDDGDALNGSEAELVGFDQDGDGTPIDLCVLVPDYIAAIPTDPQSNADPIDEDTCTNGTADVSSGYTIVQTTANRFTVDAPSVEGTNPITVTR